jgi:ribulose-phosphate 3-epimerase
LGDSELIRICPSILNADRSNLISEISRIASQSDLLHLDVMDNIFVPNQTFTLNESERIIAESTLPVDAHLMIADPDEQAHLYAKAGAKSVTFHFEASKNPTATILKIATEGARVGVALKPATPFRVIAPLLQDIDMLLIMTVEPGFGGQSFMTDMLGKIQEARTEIDAHHFGKIWLQVDGGISLETIALARSAGADTFVAGSAVFKANVPGTMVDELRALAENTKPRE